MTGLGELAAFMPVSGAFAVYGARFVDEDFSFALGGITDLAGPSVTTAFDADMCSRVITLTTSLIIQRFSQRGLSLPSYSA